MSRQLALPIALPISLVLAASDQPVTDLRGELVRIDDDETEPVPTLVPASLGHPGMFGVVPERPLAGGATYRVTCNFHRDGVDETRTAAFRTR